MVIYLFDWIFAYLFHKILTFYHLAFGGVKVLHLYITSLRLQPPVRNPESLTLNGPIPDKMKKLS